MVVVFAHRAVPRGRLELLRGWQGRETLTSERRIAGVNGSSAARVRCRPREEWARRAPRAARSRAPCVATRACSGRVRRPTSARPEARPLRSSCQRRDDARTPRRRVAPRAMPTCGPLLVQPAQAEGLPRTVLNICLLPFQKRRTRLPFRRESCAGGRTRRRRARAGRATRGRAGPRTGRARPARGCAPTPPRARRVAAPAGQARPPRPPSLSPTSMASFGNRTRLLRTARCPPVARSREDGAARSPAGARARVGVRARWQRVRRWVWRRRWRRRIPLVRRRRRIWRRRRRRLWRGRRRRRVRRRWRRRLRWRRRRRVRWRARLHV